MTERQLFCSTCTSKHITARRIIGIFKARRHGVIHEYVAANVPVLKCETCGETMYTLESEDVLEAALGDHLSRLYP
jgi:hypothetical protein